MPKEMVHVFIGDFNMKKLFPIKNIDSNPSDYRINYTVNQYNYKIIFFGGLNELVQPINSIDTFDITTYRWEKLKTKGKIPSPRHSHSA